jgi:hypothetical protein
MRLQELEEQVGDQTLKIKQPQLVSPTLWKAKPGYIPGFCLGECVGISTLEEAGEVGGIEGG